MEDTNTNPKLHIDKVSIGGKIIYQDEKITVVPGVIMMEGVQNRGLKRFEQFYDPEGLEGAMWFLGTPITREHPQDHPAGIATHITTKLGRISKVEPDPDSRTVPAEFTFFNKRLTPEEMEKVSRGEKIGDSIGYFCNEKPTEEPEIWEPTAEEYDHEEVAPFYGDHVALTANPACSGCSVNANADSSSSNCQCPNKSKKESETIPEEGDQGKQKAPAGEQNAQIDGQGGKPPEGKPPEKAEKIEKNAMDPAEMRTRARMILDLPDDYSQFAAAKKFLMDICAEPQANSAQEGAEHIEVMMNNKLIEKLNLFEKRISSMEGTVKGLGEQEAARQNAAKAQQDEQAKANAKAILLPAHQGAEFDEKYYPEIKAIGLNAWMLDNRDKVDWDALKGGKIPTPTGQQFVQHNADSEEAELIAMGLPSVEEFAAKVR